jgi:hypothetical protein
MIYSWLDFMKSNLFVYTIHNPQSTIQSYRSSLVFLGTMERIPVLVPLLSPW